MPQSQISWRTWLNRWPICDKAKMLMINSKMILTLHLSVLSIFTLATTAIEKSTPSFGETSTIKSRKLLPLCRNSWKSTISRNFPGSSRLISSMVKFWICIVEYPSLIKQCKKDKNYTGKPSLVRAWILQ